MFGKLSKFYQKHFIYDTLNIKYVKIGSDKGYNCKNNIIKIKVIVNYKQINYKD